MDARYDEWVEKQQQLYVIDRDAQYDSWLLKLIEKSIKDVQDENKRQEEVQATK
jgi:hypothetical protein